MIGIGIVIVLDAIVGSGFMGKKAKLKAKQAVEAPIDGELDAEAVYYARKVGITKDEALRIIKQASPPKLSIVPKGKSK